MDDDLQRKALAWLDEKWPPEHRPCTVCGVIDWTLGEIIYWSSDDGSVASRIYQGPGATTFRRYPELQVICRNCGHTIAFNARVMGLASEQFQVTLHVGQQSVASVESSVEKSPTKRDESEQAS